MKRISYILLLFGLISCSTVSPEQKEFKSLENLEVMQDNIFNGTVKKVSFKYPFKNIEAKLYCKDIEMVMAPVKNGLRTVYISSDRHTTSGEITCEYRFKVDDLEQKLVVSKYQIKKANYPLRKLKVPKKYAKLGKKNLERWKRESAHMKTVYSQTIRDRQLFDSPFRKPLRSKITAVYGSKRVFNDMKHSWHSGIDFRARPGTKIPSSNRGKIILARHHFFTGKTVIVDHGMGIQTMYCHLSKFKVSEGDIIPKGGIVGLSGNTGRSSGPHLHWGVRVNENWINGFTLLDIKN
jgi:murein DD-endopeptidase MepM/ murein hydrolase activator NlpD